MEAPSPQLVQRLVGWRLCSAADLRRCRPVAKRLVGDLPCFDSVWLDALVHIRRLSLFQAKVLSSSQPERLLVQGESLSSATGEPVWAAVLKQQLSTDSLWQEFRALPLEGRPAEFRNSTGPVTILEVTTVGPARGTGRTPQRTAAVGTLERLLRLDRAMRQVHSPHAATWIAALQRCAPDAGSSQFLIVEGDVTGPTLEDLLIRRGRFPLAVVEDLARQLVAGLAALEGAEVVHGDLRTTNVRISRQGAAVLLHGGVKEALSAEIGWDLNLPHDCYDGVAPERIGTGAPATTATEMYALGCLLWRLLAGRPPFTAADPLGKLNGHRQGGSGGRMTIKPFPDVRELRPDTPERLARLLSRLTGRKPESRPVSFVRLSQEFSRPGRQRLSRFVRSFESAAPRAVNRVANRWPLALTATAMLAVVAVGLAFAGGKASLLRVGQDPAPPVAANTVPRQPKTIQTASNVASPAPEVTAKKSRYLPLPPLKNGQLIFTRPGKYLATDLQSAGALEIRGLERNERVEIIVERAPWRLSGARITVDNLVIHTADGDSRVAPLLFIAAKEWSVRQCLLKSNSSIAHVTSDCQKVNWEKTLASAPGPMIQRADATEDWTCQLHSCLWRGGPAWRWPVSAKARMGEVHLMSQSSKFAIDRGKPLLEIDGLRTGNSQRETDSRALQSIVEKALHFEGEDNDLSSETQLAGMWDGKVRKTFDDSHMDVAGLTPCEVEFVGPPTLNAADWKTVGRQQAPRAPKRSPP